MADSPDQHSLLPAAVRTTSAHKCIVTVVAAHISIEDTTESIGLP